jgi:hypothetical protein
MFLLSKARFAGFGKCDRGGYARISCAARASGALHAAFLKESRIRGRVQCSVQEIRVAPSLSAQVRLGEGHPSHSFGLCYDTNSVGTLLDQFVLTNGNRAPSVVAALKPAACPTARGGQAGRAKEGLPAVVGGSGRALCSEGVGRGLVRLAQLFVDGHVVVDLRVLQGGAG